MTVFVFQEPSLLSSLQDNGLTDVMLHALLIKDVSWKFNSISSTNYLVHRCTCQNFILNWLNLNWKSVPKLPDIMNNQIFGSILFLLFIVGTTSFLFCSTLCNQFSCFFFFFRFLLLVKFWVLSLMYSVHCASMPEAYTHLFSASLSSVSSKCFCHLTTYLPCGGDGAQIH